MSKLTDEQLLLLSTVIYLDGVAVYEGKTLGYIIKKLLDENKLDDSLREDKYGNKVYPCEMSEDEWRAVLLKIQNDVQLRNLQVSDGVGTDEVDVLRAAVFSNGESATVIYRGTSGANEWHDNGTNGYLADSKQQEAALKYINNLPAYIYVKGKKVYLDNLDVAGHSKGGNLTQYVTLLSDRVARGLSIDGQGFSKEFIHTYEDEIRANRHKLYSYSAKEDFVNCLMIQLVPEHQRKFIETEYQEKFFYNHKPNILIDRLEDEVDQSPLSRLINDFTVYVITNYEEPKRSYTIDGLIAFLEDMDGKKAEEGFEQKVTSVGYLLTFLVDYKLEKGYSDDLVQYLAELPMVKNDKILSSIVFSIAEMSLATSRMRMVPKLMINNSNKLIQLILDSSLIISNHGENIIESIKDIYKTQQEIQLDAKNAFSAIKQDIGNAIDQYMVDTQLARDECISSTENLIQCLQLLSLKVGAVLTNNQQIANAINGKEVVLQIAKELEDIIESLSEMKEAWIKQFQKAMDSVFTEIKGFLTKLWNNVKEIGTDIWNIGKEINSCITEIEETVIKASINNIKSSARIIESSLKNNIQHLSKTKDRVLDWFTGSNMTIKKPIALPTRKITVNLIQLRNLSRVYKNYLQELSDSYYSHIRQVKSSLDDIGWEYSEYYRVRNNMEEVTRLIRTSNDRMKSIEQRLEQGQKGIVNSIDIHEKGLLDTASLFNTNLNYNMLNSLMNYKVS